MNRPKVLLLHSEISPYRLPLFEQLSDMMDLLVCFAKHKSGKRFWSTPLDNISFNFKVLKNISIGQLIVNYLLPFEINFAKYQVFIVDDDPRLVLSKLYILLSAKLTGKQVIVWSGAVEEGYYNKLYDIIYRFFLKPLHKIVYNNAAAFLTYGKKTADFLQKNGIGAERIFVGTQAISLQNRTGCTPDKNKLKKKLNLDYKVILLFVGYLTHRKGVYDLIKAFKRIKDADVALVIVGAGKLQERLERLTDGADNIFFPGYIDGDLKAEYYQISDIFVLPSYIDPWPVVVLEAMMHNLPVITTTGAGCTADLIDEGNVVIIKPGDVAALQKAMEHLIRDERMRTEMSKKAETARKKFTIENRKKIFIDAIEFCLSSKNRS